ncbi:unnamed protein product [Amoebophrya sp. A25]|nr:unnamed protein product [Amoebophrya sp. A25]|eukprot:GSA25T00011526001.1
MNTLVDDDLALNEEDEPAHLGYRLAPDEVDLGADVEARSWEYWLQLCLNTSDMHTVRAWRLGTDVNERRVFKKHARELYAGSAIKGCWLPVEALLSSSDETDCVHDESSSTSSPAMKFLLGTESLSFDPTAIKFPLGALNRKRDRSATRRHAFVLVHVAPGKTFSAPSERTASTGPDSTSTGRGPQHVMPSSINRMQVHQLQQKNPNYQVGGSSSSTAPSAFRTTARPRKAGASGGTSAEIARYDDEYKQKESSRTVLAASASPASKKNLASCVGPGGRSQILRVPPPGYDSTCEIDEKIETSGGRGGAVHPPVVNATNKPAGVSSYNTKMKEPTSTLPSKSLQSSATHMNQVGSSPPLATSGAAGPAAPGAAHSTSFLYSVRSPMQVYPIALLEVEFVPNEPEVPGFTCMPFLFLVAHGNYLILMVCLRL